MSSAPEERSSARKAAQVGFSVEREVWKTSRGRWVRQVMQTRERR